MDLVVKSSKKIGSSLVIPTIFVVENILARKASSTAIANDRYTAVTVLLRAWRPRLSVIEDGTLESFTSNRKLAAAMSAVKVRERIMYTCVYVSGCIYVKTFLTTSFGFTLRNIFSRRRVLDSVVLFAKVLQKIL